MPPSPPPRPVRESAESQEVLAGICAGISLRDLNLVDTLLSQLEEMEAKEEDQDRLAELYRLDHLATRLRRNAENLRVLAGRDASETTTDSASVVDVVRAAMSSIDQYTRVTIGRVVQLGVVGFAAEDLSRLLAELLDNATSQSPPDTPVRVSAHLTEQGSVLLRIEDEGIGIPDERLREVNARLATAPTLDRDSVRHMGLAVVRRLSHRHDMRVHLDRRSPHGTTATVLLPSSTVCELPGATWSGSQTVVPRAGFTRVSGTLDPEANHPIARPRNGNHGVTATGLPKRGGSAVRATAVSPLAPTKPSAATKTAEPEAPLSTTPSGLPRRVSRSIKGTVERPDTTDATDSIDDTDPIEPMGAPAEAPSATAGHDQLLADLDAFADGEQAALAEHKETSADQDQPTDRADEHDADTGEAKP
ncbi:histidine kinase/DNA gyrase B/HSP90-like ATPase [Labedaea rhizosphaerae]|uniref:histidine kinase n=1 Tax=Labedaea rhizosphaerae TaxID=598644 RepID=A0A4R6SID3_LABRH|nr:histidine kinase/DNA gyrase B/HSP90-like ATPase [Labedaea rhizosphaerae]